MVSGDGEEPLMMVGGSNIVVNSVECGLWWKVMAGTRFFHPEKSRKHENLLRLLNHYFQENLLGIDVSVFSCSVC